MAALGAQLQRDAGISSFECQVERRAVGETERTMRMSEPAALASSVNVILAALDVFVVWGRFGPHAC